MTRARPASGVIPAKSPVMLKGREVLRDEPFGESLNLGQIDHASTVCIG